MKYQDLGKVNFMICYRRLGSEYNENFRTRSLIRLSKEPNKITLKEVYRTIKDWIHDNIDSDESIKIKIVTPMDKNDMDRTLEDWFQNPTEFHKKNHIAAENYLFNATSDCYGKWDIDIINE